MDKSMVAKIMESMAMIKTPEAKRKLREDASGCTLGDWKLKSQAKCGGVGFMTGLLGGPVGLALEGADTGYLISMAGQSCYGVGHILNKPIDYDKDIEGILAIWSGVGKSASKAEIDLSSGTELAVLPIGGKILIKVSSKVGSKIALKLAAKASAKIIGKTGAKVAGKVAGKMSTKWIPGIGGIVSAAINIWIIETMITASEEYYRADYILLDDEDD